MYVYLYCQAKRSINHKIERMEQSEREKIQEELEMLKMILDAYNEEPGLRNRPGAVKYIDSILDRYNELKEMLNNTPSE